MLPLGEFNQITAYLIWLWRISLHPAWVTCMLNCFSEVLVHQFSEHGKYSGRIRDLCACRAMISLQVQRYNRAVVMTGMLPWLATCFFWKDRPGRWSDGIAFYMREQWECIELCLGKSKSRAYELKGKLTWVTLLCILTTGHLIRKTNLMKPSMMVESSFTVKGPGSYREL